MRGQAFLTFLILSVVFTTGTLIARDLNAQCLRAPGGMTGWWPGDGNTIDAIGGRSANLHDNAATGPGFVDQAFVLDGSGDFVSVAHDPALDVGSGDFTVDLWVSFNSTAGEQVVIEKYVETMGNDSTGWTLTKLAGGSLRFQLRGEASVEADVALPTNMWIHLAARRRGNDFSVFMNGVAVGSTSYSGDLQSPSSLKFGHRGSPSDTPGSNDNRGFFLNGAIDEVELFVGRALSDAEIHGIFAAGRAGKCKQAPATVPSVSGLGAAIAALTLIALMVIRLRRHPAARWLR